MTTETGLTEKPKAASALEAMAMRLQVSKETLQSTLKATAFKECKTNEEFIAAVIVANTYKLNPLLKEVTAFPGKSGGVVPVVMVDGWIKLVQNHPDYDGVELNENEEPTGKPNKSGTTVRSITATFWVRGKSKPVIVAERMDECFDGSKTPWQKWPVRMLRHKAYIQGARVAFGFSGIYDEDEAQRIIEVHATDKEAPKEMQMPRAKAASPTPEIAPEAPKSDDAPALASSAQLKTLYALAGQAELTNGKLFEFLAQRCKNTDQITGAEFQKCLIDLGTMIDQQAKAKK